MSPLFEDFAESRGGARNVASSVKDIQFLQAYETGRALLRFTFADASEDVLCNQVEIGAMLGLARKEQPNNVVLQAELHIASDNVIEQIKYRSPHP